MEKERQKQTIPTTPAAIPDISSVDRVSFVEVNGEVLTIYYDSGHKYTVTPDTFQKKPLFRLPVFNILKRELEWAKPVKAWLRTYLGLKVDFYTDTPLDLEKERLQWRQFLLTSPIATELERPSYDKGPRKQRRGSSSQK